MPALFDQLRDRILPRRDEMIADLARYIAIPTGYNYAPGLDTFRAILIARLEALGATTELLAGNARPEWLSEPADGAARKAFVPPPTAICRGKGSIAGSATRILLAGHIDTVFHPHGPFQNLTISPDGKTAIGPGVVDMKGGLLIALVALEALNEMCVPVNWTFILNSDEETGSYASDHALRAEAARHTYGLALEPALPDGGLVTERKGSGQFIIETFGKSAHAGRDFDKGVSAVYALARALTDVEQISDLPRGTTVNVGPLQGGVATNIVPDYAAAWGNVRFKDQQAADDAMRKLEAIQKLTDGPGSVRVKHSFARPAKPLTPEAESLAKTAQEVAQAIGQALPFGSSGGVCDGNNLQAAGLPTIDTLGVRGGGLHTHQEWIELQSLTDRATLLACLLARLSGAI